MCIGHQRGDLTHIEYLVISALCCYSSTSGQERENSVLNKTNQKLHMMGILSISNTTGGRGCGGGGGWALRTWKKLGSISTD